MVHNKKKYRNILNTCTEERIVLYLEGGHNAVGWLWRIMWWGACPGPPVSFFMYSAGLAESTSSMSGLGVGVLTMIGCLVVFLQTPIVPVHPELHPGGTRSSSRGNEDKVHSLLSHAQAGRVQGLADVGLNDEQGVGLAMDTMMEPASVTVCSSLASLRFMFRTKSLAWFMTAASSVTKRLLLWLLS